MKELAWLRLYHSRIKITTWLQSLQLNVRKIYRFVLRQISCTEYALFLYQMSGISWDNTKNPMRCEDKIEECVSRSNKNLVLDLKVLCIIFCIIIKCVNFGDSLEFRL